MLTNPLLLKNHTPTELSFEVLTDIPSGTRRYNPAATALEPIFLDVQHYSSTSKAVVTDRHVSKVVLRKKNAAGVDTDITVTTTVSVPRDVVITEALVKDAVVISCNLWAQYSGAVSALQVHPTNFTKLSRGES